MARHEQREVGPRVEPRTVRPPDAVLGRLLAEAFTRVMVVGPIAAVAVVTPMEQERRRLFRG